MRKRTYTIPILITLIMIFSVVFLVISLTRDPYTSAIQKGDAAMESQDYHKAISEYTIAQTVSENQIEPYLKALKAIAHSNDATVVRDVLQTINNCIEFCGVGSISDKQIIEAIDILIANNNKQAAHDILNHLHLSYFESDLINEKFISLAESSVPADSEKSTDTDEIVSSTPTPTLPASNVQTTYTPAPSYVTPKPVQTQKPESSSVSKATESSNPEETQKPTSSPKASETPSPTATPEATPQTSSAPNITSLPVAPAATPTGTPSQTATAAPSETQSQ